MKRVYDLCKLLIDRGRREGLAEKLDVYLAADRLTAEEYQALINECGLPELVPVEYGGTKE